MSLEKLKEYAPALLRYGLTVVFFWFGLSQLINPSMWFGLLPKFASSIASPTVLIYLNGAFEIILAVLLGLGLFVRIASALSVLQLLSIIILSVGYTAVGVRDFGLMILALAIFFYGPDRLSLDKKLKLSGKKDRK